MPLFHDAIPIFLSAMPLLIKKNVVPCIADVSNKKAKFIYRSLIDKIVQNPTDRFLKWEELLDIEITDLSEYFVIIKRSCRHLFEKLSV